MRGFRRPGDGEKGYRVVRSGERWLPVREIPNNLPQQATSFIGRERELRRDQGAAGAVPADDVARDGRSRQDAALAPGAAEVMAEYPDGVWFLDLAPIRDPALVVSEAAQVLGVREEPDRPLVQTLCAHLSSQRVLLVLDNCEHLVKPSADLAHAILRAAPNVHMLASSRELLHVPGEQAFPILPLPVPRRDDDLEALARSTAVRLFVERAQSHKPSFALNEREAPAVAELVARLEGIPLALELAAARVRSLSVADINTRLKDRYKVLTGGARVLQLRQQTLRALVDWSYELLNDAERRVLNRLGVFVDGFALSAAEQVCGCDPVDPDEVVDILGSLVEKSLVTLEENDEGARYRMLETIRDYASEKLKESDEAAATEARHCDHYFAMVKEANRGLRGQEQAEWIMRLETEHDNVRSAMALALAGGVDAFVAVKFAVAMQAFWILRGYSTEGRAIVRAALALPAVQGSDLAQAWALYVGAALAETQSDHAEARRMLETCLLLRRRLGNPTEIAATLSTLSLARLQEGDAIGAMESEREALATFRQLGDRFGEAIGLLHLGQIGIYLTDDEQARTQLEQCLAIARSIKHQEVEGECELLLGEIGFEGGDLEHACLRFKRSLTVCREAGDKRGEANALRWLGKTELERGEVESARRRLGEALRTFRAFEMWEELLGCLEDHAAVARVQGRAEPATHVSAAAATSREKLSLIRPPRVEMRWQAHLESLRATLSAPGFADAWREGQTWEVDQAIRSALSSREETVAA